MLGRDSGDVALGDINSVGADLPGSACKPQVCQSPAPSTLTAALTTPSLALSPYPPAPPSPPALSGVLPRLDGHHRPPARPPARHLGRRCFHVTRLMSALPPHLPPHLPPLRPISRPCAPSPAPSRANLCYSSTTYYSNHVTSHTRVTACSYYCSQPTATTPTPTTTYPTPRWRSLWTIRSKSCG